MPIENRAMLIPAIALRVQHPTIRPSGLSYILTFIFYLVEAPSHQQMINTKKKNSGKYINVI